MKRRKVIITVFSIFFILIMLLVLFNKISFFDNFVYNFLISKRNKFLDNYFLFFTKFGNVSVAVVLVILLMILFHNRYSLFFLFGSLGCVLINTIFKYIIKRDRPNILRLIKQDGYSFPSGHAMISVTLYGFLLYIVLTKVKNKYLKMIMTFLLILIILSIGISRIYLCVHYASDVVAGYILSLIYVIILIQVDLNIGGE